MPALMAVVGSASMPARTFAAIRQAGRGGVEGEVDQLPEAEGRPRWARAWQADYGRLVKTENK